LAQADGHGARQRGDQQQERKFRKGFVHASPTRSSKGEPAHISAETNIQTPVLWIRRPPRRRGKRFFASRVKNLALSRD